MKIPFLQHWRGLKLTHLKNRGREVVPPALPDDDFDADVCDGRPGTEDSRANGPAALPDPLPLPARETGVPRQFGVTTLLAITAMYALLFGVLRALQAPAPVFVEIGLLFTAVGLGQMLLFKGQRPLRASVIVGACYFAGVSIVGAATTGHLRPSFFPFDPLSGAVVGAMYGYFCGLVISGVFRILGKITATCRVQDSPPRAKNTPAPPQESADER